MLEVEDKKEQEETDGLLLVSFVMVWPEQDMENLKMESFLVGRSYYTPLGLGLERFPGLYFQKLKVNYKDNSEIYSKFLEIKICCLRH